MIQVIVTRWANTPFGVFGTLSIPERFRCYTLEDDWLDNARGVSCIPPGNYSLRKVLHHGTLPTYEVYPVTDRSHIHIHPGNTEEDTEGCVLLGTYLGSKNVRDEDDPDHRNVNKWAVLDSRRAHRDFMAVLDGAEEAGIAIRWQVP